MPARVEACSIVIEQMLPSLSTSRIVFSSRSRVSTTGASRNSISNVSVSSKYRIFIRRILYRRKRYVPFRHPVEGLPEDIDPHPRAPRPSAGFYRQPELFRESGL